MKRNYTIEVGRVDKNKIVYDGERLSNTYTYGSGNLIFLDGDLKLSVVVRSGRIYGLSGDVGRAESWQRNSVQIPQFMDGNIILKPGHKILPNANYFFNKITGLTYDESKKALLIGNENDAQLTVRVAHNLYVMLDEREICGAIICPIINADMIK